MVTTSNTFNAALLSQKRVKTSVTPGQSPEVRNGSILFGGRDDFKIRNNKRFNPSLAKLHFGLSKLSFDPTRSPMAELQRRGVMVIGANGLMGRDILQNARQGLFTVHAIEMDPLDANTAIEKTDQKIAAAKQNGYVDSDAYNQIMTGGKANALTRISGAKLTDIKNPLPYTKQDFPNCGIVIEAIFEDINAKKALFHNLEAVLPKDTILATNTSSLSVNEMAEVLKPENRKRFIGLHYFMPAISNQLVEIIPSKYTDPAVVEKVRRFVEANGKVPVIIGKDSPAFVANRLLMSVMATEALKLYEEGYGDSKTIDKVAKKLFWPMGVGIKSAEEKMMPPFVLINKYRALAVEIAKNCEKLGDGFKVSPVLMAEHERVQKLTRERLKPLKDELAFQREAYNKLRDQILALQGKQTHYKKDADYQQLVKNRDMQDAKLKNLEAGVEELEKQAQYFPNGLPAPSNLRSESLPVREKMIEERLSKAYHDSARQMVNEGLCSLEDVDNIARLGFKWAIPEAEQAEERSWIKVSPVKNGVLSIKLDRVQDLMGKANFNTIGISTAKAIEKAVKEANNPKVKTIVFEANGGSIFSGGANLEEVLGNDDLKKMTALVEQGRAMMDTIAKSPKVTIAKVNGGAYGGGGELALACDYIVASDQASFSWPEVNWGIVPAWRGTKFLPQKIGKPLAKALILNGRTKTGLVSGFDKNMPGFAKLVNNVLGWDMDKPGFSLDVKDAQKLGLVQLVVPHAQLNDAMEQILENPGALEKPEPAYSQRGLKQFQKPEDYPEDIRRKFRLDTIVDETHPLKHALTRPAWELANRLIDVSDHPEKADHFESAELQAAITSAAQKNEKLTELLDAGLSFAKYGQYSKKGIGTLLKSVLLNQQIVPGTVQALTSKKSQKKNQQRQPV
ncbi:MAG TPA: 3-hydroxyacyl-CoA dehydrogenase/enoyl-CoA hydratase family protein [Coleofasciculaceae cyanobacterium]|jgi:3-hydroxyacyl-CoA dehydrogenase